MTKRDPKLIRIHDRARIVVPKVVKRVGYPKIAEDYLPELREKHGAQIDALFTAITGRRVYPRDVTKPSRQRRAIERELAHLMAQANGFGGNERIVHFIDRPDLLNVEVIVQDVIYKKTGERIAPWSNYDAYNGDWDADPGGLANAKTHRICVVSVAGQLWSVDDKLMVLSEHLQKTEAVDYCGCGSTSPNTPGERCQLCMGLVQ